MIKTRALRSIRFILACVYITAALIVPVAVQANTTEDQQAIADYIAAGGSLADLCLTEEDTAGLTASCEICNLANYTFEPDQSCHSLLTNFPDEAITFLFTSTGFADLRLEANAAIRTPPFA